MSNVSKLGWFAAGTLFGSVGIKLLTSRDAVNVYVHATAAGLRVKDQVMDSVTNVQEAAADILASAKDLNDERAKKEAEEMAAAEVQDQSQEVQDETEN